MSDFFKQPHIFVVFFPGSSGNLISSMLDSLITPRESVIISTSGHAHNNSINERKKKGTDFLSMGSGIVSKMQFASNEEKLNYYKEKILQSDYDASKRYVTWSHDYSNIPLYNSLFPNAKILTISSNTLRERLIAMLLKVNKNSFCMDNELPATAEDIALIDRAKKYILALTIRKYYGIHCRQVPDELQDTDLLKYLTYRFYYDTFEFGKFESLHSTVPNISARIKFDPETNDMVLSDPKPLKIEGIRNHYEISFDDILTNSDKIPMVFEHLLDRELTNTDRAQIKETLIQYIEKQEPLILADPMLYINMYKERADKIISEWVKA